VNSLALLSELEKAIKQTPLKKFITRAVIPYPSITAPMYFPGRIPAYPETLPWEIAQEIPRNSRIVKHMMKD
jgi:hypothetical protein